jgi:hypothetical protein
MQTRTTTMASLKTLAGMLALLVVFSSGCRNEENAGLPSSSASQPPPAAATNPLNTCAVLTRADVEAVLGVGVSEGQARADEFVAALHRTAGRAHSFCRRAYFALKWLDAGGARIREPGGARDQ